MSTRNVQNRRSFMMSTVAGAALLTGGRCAFAQGAPVTEADPQAAALGYKDDTTKVDAAKYPKHVSTDKCGNCSLYQGKPSDANGPCAIFPGKVVAEKGWCSAWNKKVG